MNYYLVDYENVTTHGLDGITMLSLEDVVCIFYSENADRITFGLHRRLNEAAAKIIYQEVEVGTKNALDFQLASYLGYIIHENKDKEVSYFIVTKDQGFSSLVHYWKKQKIDISLVLDLSGKNEETIQSELKSRVEQLIADKEEVNIVVKLIQQYKTKQGLNNALMKQFPSKDNKKASEIYTAIKPLIAGKKGR